MKLKLLGTSRGREHWRLPNGREFLGTREQAEVAAGLRAATEPVTTESGDKPIESMTKKELQAALTEKGIEFDPKATNAELIELLTPES